MTSPTVRPGNGTPCRIAELSCWKLVSALGCTDWRMSTTLASGTSLPEVVLDLVAVDPVRREAEVARHLRDHLVAAAIKIEAVDPVAAEQRRQRAADVLHGDAEAVGLVVVDLHLDLRRIELQVGVGEDEKAALGGFRCMSASTCASCS